MTNFFEFILGNLWVFIGFCIILSGIGTFILQMIKELRKRK